MIIKTIIVKDTTSKVVCFVGDDIVARAYLIKHKSGLKLCRVFVIPKMRGKGIANELMQYIIDNFKSPISLQACPWGKHINPNTIEDYRKQLIYLYSKYGFVLKDGTKGSMKRIKD